MLVKQSKVMKLVPARYSDFEGENEVLGQIHSFERQKQNKESEICLQERIIQLYSLIERKTIDNIELKKMNEIIEGQIEAYHTIVGKIGMSQSLNKKVQNFDMSMEEKRKSMRDFERNDFYETKVQVQKNVTEEESKNNKIDDYFQFESSRNYDAQNLRHKNQRASCLEVFGEVQNIEKTQRKNINMHRKRRSCGQDQFQFSTYNPRIDVENKSKAMKSTKNLSQKDRRNCVTKSMKKYEEIDIEALWNNTKPSFGQAGLRNKNEMNEKGRAKESFELIKNSSKFVNTKLKLKK